MRHILLEPAAITTPLLLPLLRHIIVHIYAPPLVATPFHAIIIFRRRYILFYFHTHYFTPHYHTPLRAAILFRFIFHAMPLPPLFYYMPCHYFHCFFADFRFSYLFSHICHICWRHDIICRYVADMPYSAICDIKMP